MTLPTIHYNGTHRKDLYEQYDVALHAVRTAIDELIAARPNARDYYTQDNTPYAGTAFTVANAEHQCRIDKLIKVRLELEQLLAHVVDAPGPNPL